MYLLRINKNVFKHSTTFYLPFKKDYEYFSYDSGFMNYILVLIKIIFTKYRIFNIMPIFIFV